MAKIPDVKGQTRPTPRATRGTSNVMSLAGIRAGAANRELAAAPGAGDAWKAMAGAAEQIAQTIGVMNNRRDAIDRLRLNRQLREFGEEGYTRFTSEADLLRPQDGQIFNETLKRRADELLEEHAGSPESRIQLEQDFDNLLFYFSDKAAVAVVKSADDLIDREFSAMTSSLAARVRQGEDPDAVIAQGMAFLEKHKDALRPIQERAFADGLRSEVFQAKINDFMAKAEFDSEEFSEFMSRPDVLSSLGATGRKAIFDRVEAARREGNARILTPGETSSLGFPPGVIVQRKSNGDFNVVFKPESDQTERSKKIENITQQLVNSGESEEAARTRATNIVDGNIRFEIVPNTGRAREINDVEATVREVPLGMQSGQTRMPPKRTLADLAASGTTAGFEPGIVELWNRTAGQIPGIPISEVTSQSRQEIRIAQNGLIRALSINPRYPVGEINRLLKEIEIAPALFDSPRALLSRMVGIKEQLAIRLENERSIADNPNMPEEMRGNAEAAATHIDQFLRNLGNPEALLAAGPPKGVPDFSKKIGKTKEGKDVWETPDGRQLVVE